MRTRVSIRMLCLMGTFIFLGEIIDGAAFFVKETQLPVNERHILSGT